MVSVSWIFYVAAGLTCIAGNAGWDSQDASPPRPQAASCLPTVWPVSPTLPGAADVVSHHCFLPGKQNTMSAWLRLHGMGTILSAEHPSEELFLVSVTKMKIKPQPPLTSTQNLRKTTNRHFVTWKLWASLSWLPARMPHLWQNSLAENINLGQIIDFRSYVYTQRK